MEVHRGEVFYADLSPVVGSEQGGVRPVLIIQNDIGNRHSPTVIAATITNGATGTWTQKQLPNNRENPCRIRLSDPVQQREFPEQCTQYCLLI